MDGAWPTTYRSALKRLVEELRLNPIDHPTLEARLILQFTLDCTAETFLSHLDAVLSLEQWEAAEHVLSRRKTGEPLSRIRGEREFWSLPFRISPATLDPRPDTETLVQAVKEAYKTQHHEKRILDLGTGSGCILIALLHEWPTAKGLGLI